MSLRLSRIVLLACMLALVSLRAQSPIGVAPGAAAVAGEKWALLVAIDGYESPEINGLQFCVADARAVAETLIAREDFPPGHVYLMTGADTGEMRATHVNVFKRLDALAKKVRPGDTFLFYFAGHGFTREGKHFLATVNADSATVETLQLTAVPLEMLKAKMSKIAARQTVFILDACRNDPEKGRGEGDNVRTAELSVALADAARATGGGLAGSALLFACAEGERAYDWPEQGHGVFSYYLVEGLGGGAAEPDGQLTLTGLADYTQRKVQAWCEERNKRQRPDLLQQGAAKIVLADKLIAPITPGGTVEAVDTTARLRITSEPPGAKVLLDSVVQVQTTPCILAIELGVARTKTLEVGITLTGYADEVRNVTLERGKRTELALTLREKAAPTPLPNPAPAGGIRPPADPKKKWQQTINPIDGAVILWVPAGEFLMGSTDADKDARTDEKPQHRVYLDGYWIYQTEVTVAQYRKFCQATGRQMPPEPEWKWQDTHPVNVSWDDAKAYVDWAGASLPMEAQWEKAARGSDGRIYPWGNEWDGAKCVNSVGGNAPGGTKPVGGMPAGVSPYGCLDMAGNVWEWCADWYDGSYYKNTPSRNPTGPATGTTRVLRGGAWFIDNPANFRAAYRNYYRYFPSFRSCYFGFRCVLRSPGQ